MDKADAPIPPSIAGDIRMPHLIDSARRHVSRLLGGAAAVALGSLAFHAPQAVAQTYPDKPVKIVVGFAPGGTNDSLARLIAGKLEAKLGQTFVVENKTGAASSIANAFVARSNPDGYTLLVSSSGGLTTNPVLMKNLPYDPAKDFEPIAMLATFPLIVTVPASLPVNNLADLVKFSKTSKDGRLDNGSPTTSFILVAETLSEASGMKFNHIPYRGSGPVVMALLGGEIQVGVLDSSAVMSNIKAGKLKPLAVTTGKRSPALPDVPTIAESGYAGYDIPLWTALMAPKGTPEAVLAKLRSTVGEILADKATIDALHAQGMEPGNADSAALGKRIVSDIARWSRVAETAHIEPK
jgi:tripartite-type tricarboxylate transporter receptor subunit TctC